MAKLYFPEEFEAKKHLIKIKETVKKLGKEKEFKEEFTKKFVENSIKVNKYPPKVYNFLLIKISEIIVMLSREYTNEELEFLYYLIYLIPKKEYSSYIDFANDTLKKDEEGKPIYEFKFLKKSTSTERKNSLTYQFKMFMKYGVILKDKTKTKKAYKSGLKGIYEINSTLYNKLGLQREQLKYILKSILNKKSVFSILLNFPIEKEEIEKINKRLFIAEKMKKELSQLIKEKIEENLKQ